MPASRSEPVAPIAMLTSEWRWLGRSAAAVHALDKVAERDPDLARLVHGDGRHGGAGPCRTPAELVLHMRRQAKGRGPRESAAALVRVLLREAGVDPLVSRILLQAMLPGMITLAGRMQWGEGGEWVDGDDFFAELLTTMWTTIEDWSGQDRPYAALDLLSAVRCRLRRQLLRAKEERDRLRPLREKVMANLKVAAETDLEALSRQFIALLDDGMRTEEVEVLYAQHVLGFTIAELAIVTGRKRRVLYARRDRGLRRLCA